MFFFAAIAEVLRTKPRVVSRPNLTFPTPRPANRDLRGEMIRQIRYRIADKLMDNALVPHRDALKVAALELAANGFRGGLVEAGKTGAIERLVALLDPLGEGVG
jgi:hypothetical protein